MRNKFNKTRYTIEIPLKERFIKSVSVKFPNKCIICGAPQTDTIPETIHRKHNIAFKGNKPTYIEDDLEPIDIPYCNQHIETFKNYDEQGKKLVGVILYPILIIVGILNIVLFFKPIYNWLKEPSSATFVPSFGPILTPILGFVMTVFFILLITVAVSFGLFSIMGSVYPKIKAPPNKGIETIGAENLFFIFDNELIADEFLTLNQDLGALSPNNDRTVQ